MSVRDACSRLSCLLLGALVGLPAAPACAGDLVAFVSDARPEELWDRGYGAALSFSFFRIATFEGEAARQPAVGDGRDMTSFTGSALLSPPIGRLVPYAGLGVGLYRQSASDSSDTDTLRVLVVGLKVGLGGLVVLKAEYRDFELSDDALLFLDKRFSIGAGISF
jgi:hypothetical protein